MISVSPTDRQPGGVNQTSIFMGTSSSLRQGCGMTNAARTSDGATQHPTRIILCFSHNFTEKGKQQQQQRTTIDRASSGVSVHLPLSIYRTTHRMIKASAFFIMLLLARTSVANAWTTNAVRASTRTWGNCGIASTATGVFNKSSKVRDSFSNLLVCLTS